MLYCIVLYCLLVYTLYHKTLYHTLYCMMIFTVYNYILYTIVYCFQDVLVYRFIHYYATNILKVDFLCAVKTLVLTFCTRKNAKISQKSHVVCEIKRKTVKEFKMHRFFSLCMQITRFCAMLENICSVPRP